MANQIGFEFPQPLTEKYRPTRIADFAGLEKPKKIISEENKEEVEKEKFPYKSDEETQEPEVTENDQVTHISPPCNEG